MSSLETFATTKVSSRFLSSRTEFYLRTLGRQLSSLPFRGLTSDSTLPLLVTSGPGSDLSNDTLPPETSGHPREGRGPGGSGVRGCVSAGEMEVPEPGVSRSEEYGNREKWRQGYCPGFESLVRSRRQGNTCKISLTV